MIVTKAVAMVEAAETDDANGAFEVILSAATLDRDGEIVDSRAFEPLPDHIPFDIDHDMTVLSTVGSGKPYYAEDGTLRVKGVFASTSTAQEVRTLVAEGHIRTTSVTFMAADREPDEKGVQHVKSAELLNGTFCPIPSNREAVVLSAKGMREMTTPANEKDVRAAFKKALAESYEDRQESVSRAVYGAYEDEKTWAFTLATFDDDVVFRVVGGASEGTWRASYTMNEDGTATLGDAEKVRVAQVITTVTDSQKSPEKVPEKVPAVKAATDSATDSADRSEEEKSATERLFENAARAFGA